MQLGQCSVTRDNFTHHCPPVGYCRNLVQKKDFSLFNYMKEKYLLTTSLLQYAFLSKMTSHISGLNKTATVLELKGRRNGKATDGCSEGELGDGWCGCSGLIKD